MISGYYQGRHVNTEKSVEGKYMNKWKDYMKNLNKWNISNKWKILCGVLGLFSIIAMASKFNMPKPNGSYVTITTSTDVALQYMGNEGIPDSQHDITV